MPSSSEMERQALCVAALHYARAAYQSEEIGRRVASAREVVRMVGTPAAQTEEFEEAAAELARLTLLHAGQQ